MWLASRTLCVAAILGAASGLYEDQAGKVDWCASHASDCSIRCAALLVP
jgi:hypothetical protein